MRFARLAEEVCIYIRMVSRGWQTWCTEVLGWDCEAKQD